MKVYGQISGMLLWDSLLKPAKAYQGDGVKRSDEYKITVALLDDAEAEEANEMMRSLHTKMEFRFKTIEGLQPELQSALPKGTKGLWMCTFRKSSVKNGVPLEESEIPVALKVKFNPFGCDYPVDCTESSWYGSTGTIKFEVKRNDRSSISSLVLDAVLFDKFVKYPDVA